MDLSDLLMACPAELEYLHLDAVLIDDDTIRALARFNELKTLQFNFCVFNVTESGDLTILTRLEELRIDFVFQNRHDAATDFLQMLGCNASLRILHVTDHLDMHNTLSHAMKFEHLQNLSVPISRNWPVSLDEMMLNEGITTLSLESWHLLDVECLLKLVCKLGKLDTLQMVSNGIYTYQHQEQPIGPYLKSGSFVKLVKIMRGQNRRLIIVCQNLSEFTSVPNDMLLANRAHVIICEKDNLFSENQSIEHESFFHLVSHARFLSSTIEEIVFSSMLGSEFLLNHSLSLMGGMHIDDVRAIIDPDED